MKLCASLSLAVLLAGCVGPPLRHAASLTAAQVQDFNSGISRFDKAHRAAIVDADTRATRLLALANATDAAVSARVLSLKAEGDTDALRVFDAATPPLAAEPVIVSPTKSPSYDIADQQALLDALNKTAAKPTGSQNVQLLLGFAIQVASQMKADAAAATPPATASQGTTP